MNDLELISAFRSDVEAPGEADTALARVALMEAIAGEQVAAVPDRRPASKRRWWWMVSAVAVAAAALLVASATLTGRNDGTTQGALAAVLHRVAATAASRPQTPALRPGQYVYTKSVGLEESDTYDVGVNHKQYFAVLLPTVRQTWFGANGGGLLVEWSGTPRFPTAHDRQVWIASGRPPLGGNRFDRERLDPGSSLDLTGLPTDPAQLSKLIEERRVEGGPKGNDETFTIIGDMLRETYAPPKLRAALFQIAADLPNVHLFGATTWTPRRGVAIGYISAGTRHELALDPKTSALLGERTVSVKTGAVTSQVLYVASGVVGSIRTPATAIP
jgi:hypothetical protein